MPFLPLDGKHGGTTSGVACHHRLWAAQTVGQRRALHAIIAFNHHIQSNDIGRGMPSLPLGSTQGQTTSGVACHRRLWASHTVEQRQAWHAIIAFGQHTRSATSGVALHYCPWNAHTVGIVWRGMTSPPLESTHGQQRRAWHEIVAFGLHTRSNVRCDMPSQPLNNTQS